MTSYVDCPYCGATGDCNECDGAGEEIDANGDSTGEECSQCAGSGECFECEGTGELAVDDDE